MGAAVDFAAALRARRSASGRTPAIAGVFAIGRALVVGRASPIGRAPARALVGLGFALVIGLAHAQSTPVGVWKTIDDDSHAAKSLIRITEAGGVLSGTLEKLLDPAAPVDAVCAKCSDERKDKPIVGMTLIRNVRHSPRDSAVWDGGDILDPGNGKIYRVRLKPLDGGARLEVRGYIGTPLFGRTQTWIRAE